MASSRLSWEASSPSNFSNFAKILDDLVQSEIPLKLACEKDKVKWVVEVELFGIIDGAM